MGTRIAIIKPKDTDGAYFNPCYRSVDIGEVAGSLLRAGAEVSVSDGDFQKIPTRGTFDLVAMYITYRNAQKWLDVEYVESIKSISKRGIAAYGEPTSMEDPSLMRHFEYVVRGGDWGAGVMETLNASVSAGMSRLVHVPFDRSGAWPMPALELLPTDEYRSRIPREYAAFSDLIAISGSKGCSFSCAFCTAPRVEGLLEIKSDPYRIVEYFEKYATRYKKPLVTVFGPNFLVNGKWARDVCEGLIQTGTNDISWKAVTAPKTVTPKAISLMGKAGCYQLGIGIETFSRAYPLPVVKHVTKEDVKNIIRLMRDEGIVPEFFLIRGLPGVSDKQTDEDADFIRSNEGIVRLSQYVDYESMTKEYAEQGTCAQMLENSVTLGKRWRVEEK